MRLPAILFLAALNAFAVTAHAQNIDCIPPINGTLKGEAGNDQDNMFHSLVVDPTDDRIAYVGTETNGIFKTTDGGLTWTRLRVGLKCTTTHNLYPEIYDLAIDPLNHDIVYAATVTGPGPASPATFPSASAGVYKSTDGGQTWVQKNTGLPNTYVTQILPDATQANRVYAVVGGLTASFPTGSNTFYNGGIYVSVNGGDSWSAFTLPTGVNTNTFSHAALAGADQRTIYASGQTHKSDAAQAYGLVRSTDGGATWTASLNPPNEKVQGFDVFKQDANFIYANLASGSRVRKSVDGGANWTSIGPQIFFGTVKIHPTNNQIAYYTGSPSGSIWKTTDGFTTVQQVYFDAGLVSGQIMSDIEIAPSNANTIWATVNGYFVYRSANGGQTWTKSTGVRDAIYGASNSGGNDPVTTVAPVKFSGTSSADSFIRIINPTATAGMAQIAVRDDEGTLLGSFMRSVDPYTAPQFSMLEIETAATVQKPSRTGSFAQIQVEAQFSGFVQHVVYDGANNVFTNLSLCRSTVAAGSAAVGSSTLVANVHTTRISGYPSKILLQNGESVPASAAIDVYDSVTGALINRWTSPPILGLGSIVVSVAKIQQDLNFTPTAAQTHLTLNRVSTENVVISHIVDNTAAGLEIDMSVRCAF